MTEYRFGDICKVINGRAYRQPELLDSGKYPVLRVGNFFSSDRWFYSDLELPEDKYCDNGDLLFAWSASFGPRIWDGGKVIYHYHIWKLEPDEAVVDKHYLHYWLCKSVNILTAGTHGSVMAHMTKGDMENQRILLPNLEVQRRVGTILRILDDKIELNNKINENLQQQAKAIFKAWFVDFEPFGRSIPPDWTILTLDDVSQMGAGGDKPKNVSSIQTEAYPYPIYSNGLSDEGLYGYTDTARISEESVTVSARGTIGFVCLRHIPYVPIVRLVTLVPKTDILSAKYLYLYLSQLHITGTGTTQQQLTVPDFRKTEILVPTKDIVDTFTDIANPLFDKMWANQVENKYLSSLRDTLLPKLMSGEIDVSDIDI